MKEKLEYLETRPPREIPFGKNSPEKIGRQKDYILCILN